MKEFQNVQSKVSTHNTVKLHPKILNKKVESLSKVNFDSNFMVKNENVEENIYSTNIENYTQDNDIKIMGKNDYVISHVINYDNEKQSTSKIRTSRPKSNTKTNLNVNAIKSKSTDKIQVTKQKIKGPTPKADELNNLLPKKQVNHLAENKNLEKIPIRAKEMKKEDEQFDHKNYGKIPDYINKYKQEAEDKKEAEKRKEEESKYPKGTRMLSEEERLENLDNLYKTKKEIENALFSLPITLRTLSMQNKKAELESKLDELDKAINQFSKKKVFIKSD
jgi:hypothetical protein